MIYTIDELIGQHWAGCDVLQGETPEAYASRHEEADWLAHHCYVLLHHTPLIFLPIEES